MYRLIFILARFLAIDTTHAKMHREQSRRDALQSLGSPPDEPAPVRLPRGKHKKPGRTKR